MIRRCFCQWTWWSTKASILSYEPPLIAMGCQLSTDRVLALEQTLQSLQSYVDSPITQPQDLAGIVKGFEMANELLWKCFQDQVILRGYSERGPKLSFVAGIRAGIIPADLEQGVRQMLDDRNLAAQTYRPGWAEALVPRIREQHLPLMRVLAARLNDLI